jgi:hypothetical protein
MLFSCSVSYRAGASDPFSDGFMAKVALPNAPPRRA